MRLLLENGCVVDGTGAAARNADVLVEDGRIAAIAPAIAAEAVRIGCAGLVVAPGFLDAHSHSDLMALEGRPEKLQQGVTAEVVGNCGFSAFPCGCRAGEVREFANPILCGEGDWQYPTAAAYLEAAGQAPAASLYTLVGHGSLRVAYAGMRQGPLEAAALDAMDRALAGALEAGAVGFSTGLMYAPGSGAPFEELRRLCTTVARHGAIYCTHMRNYSHDLLSSVEEQLRLAGASGCRLEISHLQAVGRANWPLQERVLERIEAARRAGIDVAFDSYPYLAGSTVLQQLVPQDALDGGVPAFLARLSEAGFRRETARRTREGLAQAWSDVYISGVGSHGNQVLVGRNLAEIAAARASDPAETVLDLLLEERGQVTIVSFNQSESNLRALLTHPLCTVVSDGFYVKGRPHPRLFGTFPEWLGNCCRRKQWLGLEEAVHKITGRPAERFGLKDRGVLRAGASADITVFDAATVGSRADYDNPRRAPEGIVLVLRQGREIFRRATPPASCPG